MLQARGDQGAEEAQGGCFPQPDLGLRRKLKKPFQEKVTLGGALKDCSPLCSSRSEGELCWGPWKVQLGGWGKEASETE